MNGKMMEDDNRGTSIDFANGMREKNRRQGGRNKPKEEGGDKLEYMG